MRSKKTDGDGDDEDFLSFSASRFFYLLVLVGDERRRYEENIISLHLVLLAPRAYMCVTDVTVCVYAFSAARKLQNGMCMCPAPVGE